MLRQFAHAYNRRQSRFERGQRPLQHGLVRLAEILPALAVPYNHVRASRSLNHGRGDFAGESTFFGPIQVLRSDLTSSAARSPNDSEKFSKGRAERIHIMI